MTGGWAWYYAPALGIVVPVRLQAPAQTGSARVDGPRITEVMTLRLEAHKRAAQYAAAAAAAAATAAETPAPEPK